MEQIKITPQLLKHFHSASDMLIFEGYCRYSDNAVIFREGDNYALVVKIKDVYKCCFATDDLSFVDEVISPLKGNVELCGVDPQITDYLRDKYAFEYDHKLTSTSFGSGTIAMGKYGFVDCSNELLVALGDKTLNPSQFKDGYSSE